MTKCKGEHIRPAICEAVMLQSHDSWHLTFGSSPRDLDARRRRETFDVAVATCPSNNSSNLERRMLRCMAARDTWTVFELKAYTTLEDFVRAAGSWRHNSIKPL